MEDVILGKDIFLYDSFPFLKINVKEDNLSGLGDSHLERAKKHRYESMKKIVDVAGHIAERKRFPLYSVDITKESFDATFKIAIEENWDEATFKTYDCPEEKNFLIIPEVHLYSFKKPA